MSFRTALVVHIVHRVILVCHEKKMTPFFNGLSSILYLHKMSFKHNHSEIHTVYIFCIVTLNHIVASHD